MISGLRRWTSGTLLVALASCGGDGPKARGQAEGAGRPQATEDSGVERRDADAQSRRQNRDFRVATYNAGLAVGVLKYAEERVAPLVRTLAEQRADLLCVQELWLEEHWQKLVLATKEVLPNTYRLPPEKVSGSCEAEELTPLVACATASCSGRPLHELAYCMLRSCARPLERLSPDCFQCLAASPRGSPADLALACAPRGKKEGAPASASTRRKGGPESFRVYSGSSGTGLLTNAEILEQDALILPSVLDRRAVLYAKLATPVGELHTFCTHLTANLGGVPHPGRGSFQLDQSAQIDALIGFMEQKASGGTALLLGDLNTGPAVAPHISSILPRHYERLLGRGFLNPYASQADVKCTYCFDNPLEGKSGTRGHLIDHILLRNFTGRVTSEQMMRPSLMLEHGGRPVQSGYSDHYGVTVTLSTPET